MKHLYGIIPSQHKIALGPNLTGVRGERLHTIAHNGITALVSDSAYAEYDGLYKPTLVQMLAEHQRVTEQILPQVDGLLPVKFGTLLSKDEVHTLLAQAHADLEKALHTLTGQVEIEVVATWEPEKVFAELAQDSTIAQLRAAAAGRTPAEVQQIQMIVGQLVKRGLDARRASYQEQLLASLKDAATDLEINPVMNEQVVANVAFLLPTEKQTEFDQKVESLDSQLNGQLNFKVVGPLPAYSFSTVEVVKISPEDVDWARELLELGDSASADEIRAAYLRQARRHHPDTAQAQTAHDEDDVTAFTDINNAYQLLQHCYTVQAAGRPSADAAPFRCDFSPLTVDGTLLVNICRSSDLATS